MGYVWQKDQILQLGERIAKREQSLEALRKQNEKLRRDLLTLRSPANLERLVEHYNLGLVEPAPDQVIRLPEPGPLPGPPSKVARPTPSVASRSGFVWSP